MKKVLPILAAVVLLGLAVTVATSLAAETAPCTLAQASSPDQARIQATCVAAKRNLRALSRVRHEGGWRVRVPADACTLVSSAGPLYSCRFSGFVGDIGCQGRVRVTGNDSNPANLVARVVSRRCVR
jgi:hypothetical protein